MDGVSGLFFLSLVTVHWLRPNDTCFSAGLRLNTPPEKIDIKVQEQFRSLQPKLFSLFKACLFKNGVKGLSNLYIQTHF